MNLKHYKSHYREPQTGIPNFGKRPDLDSAELFRSSPVVHGA